MKIRKATFHDAPFIKLLLYEQGRETNVSLLITQINTMFCDNDHEVWVYEDQNMVNGFAVLHLLPRLGSELNLLVVSGIFGVDQTALIALERHINDLMRKRNSERITL